MAVNPVTIGIAQGLFSAATKKSHPQGHSGQPLQPGQQQYDQEGPSELSQFATRGLKSYDDSVRRDQLVIRGPPPKESVSMVKYIVIAVVIMVMMIIYFVMARKPQETPHYQSIFDSFTPNRAGLLRAGNHLAPEGTLGQAPRVNVPVIPSNSALLFGIMPRQPMNIRV